MSLFKNSAVFKLKDFRYEKKNKNNRNTQVTVSTLSQTLKKILNLVLNGKTFY